MPPSNYEGLGEIFDGTLSLGKYQCVISVRPDFGSTSSLGQGVSQDEKLPGIEGTMLLGATWRNFINDQGEIYELRLDNGEKYNIFFESLGDVAQLAFTSNGL